MASCKPDDKLTFDSRVDVGCNAPSRDLPALCCGLKCGVHLMIDATTDPYALLLAWLSMAWRRCCCCPFSADAARQQLCTALSSLIQ